MKCHRMILLATFLGLVPSAHAHFKLIEPASRTQQSDQTFGGPQKSAPCGLSDSANNPDQSVPTNAITTVRTGSVLTVSINEMIDHPGHYRVLLAPDIASLPADPIVTPAGTPCGSIPIDPNPSLPLLADGLFVHTQSFNQVTQTAHVQLPAGMTCTNCVLQVVEFMSSHPLNNPGGCFYHHCAIVNISDTAPDVDGAVIAGDDAGTTPGGGSTGGCCNTNRDGSLAGLLLAALVVGGLVVRRRRR